MRTKLIFLFILFQLLGLISFAQKLEVIKYELPLLLSDSEGNDNSKIADDIITVKYKITPKFTDIGIVKIGEEVTKDFIVEFLGGQPYSMSELSLKSYKENLTSHGFDLNYSFDINELMQPGEKRQFTVTFKATKPGTFQDSIGCGDSCFYFYHAFVRATAGSPKIHVSDFNFGMIEVGKQYTGSCNITNNGLYPLTITGYKNNTQTVFTNSVDFLQLSKETPLIINENETLYFNVTFQPDVAKFYLDSIVFESDAGDEDDPVCYLNGLGGANSVAENEINNFNILITPNPVMDYITVDLGNTTANGGVDNDLSLLLRQASIRIFDILGNGVLTTPSLRDNSAREGQFRINVSSLSPGVYFVRIGDLVQKFMVVR